MSPEEIAELNRIAPEIATGLAEVGNQSGDPIAGMSEYNSEYGDGSGDGAYYPSAADEAETFEDIENFDESENVEHLDGSPVRDDYASVARDVVAITQKFKENFYKRHPEFLEENFDRENWWIFGNKKKNKEARSKIGKFLSSIFGGDSDKSEKDKLELFDAFIDHADSTSDVHLKISEMLLPIGILGLGYYVYRSGNKMMGLAIAAIGGFLGYKHLKGN